MTTGSGIAVCGIWLGAGAMGTAVAITGAPSVIFPIVLFAAVATFCVS